LIFLQKIFFGTSTVYLSYLLPQVSSEYLNERDLEGGDLSVHEDSGQVKLDLETDVNVGAVDGRRPPQCEATIRNLVQTGSLSVGQLLVLHRLLKAGSLFPEETFPSREVGSLEERVLENAFDSTQSLDHVSSVIVQVPELSVVTLVSPPKRVLFENLVSLELGSHSPALVVGQGVSVFLEEGVDSGNTSIPGIFQILKGQSPILSCSFLTFQSVLGPDSLRIDEFGFPRLNIPVQVGDQLVFFVTHSGSEVSDSDVRLFGPTQVGLRNEDVTHGEHAETAEFFRSVENDRRESGRHFRVETDLDSSLDLVFALDQEVEKFLSVDDGLAEVGHQTDQGGVPLVDDLGERGGTRRHQNLN